MFWDVLWRWQPRWLNGQIVEGCSEEKGRKNWYFWPKMYQIHPSTIHHPPSTIHPSAQWRGLFPSKKSPNYLVCDLLYSFHTTAVYFPNWWWFTCFYAVPRIYKLVWTWLQVHQISCFHHSQTDQYISFGVFGRKLSIKLEKKQYYSGACLSNNGALKIQLQRVWWMLNREAGTHKGARRGAHTFNCFVGDVTWPLIIVSMFAVH